MDRNSITASTKAGKPPAKRPSLLATDIPLAAGRPGSKRLHAYCLALRSAIGAGVPIISAFQLVADSVPHRGLRKASTAIAQELDHGVPLEKALRSQRGIFSRFFANVVLGGARAGDIPHALDLLIEHYAWLLELRAAIFRVIWYPLVLLFAGAAIMIARDVIIFSMGRGVVSGESVGAIVWSYVKPLFLGVAGAYLLSRLVRARPVRPATDELFMRLPIVRKHYGRYSLAVFFRALALSIEAGNEIGAAVEAAVEAMDNHYFARRLRRAIERVRAGEGLADALQLTHVIPAAALAMVQVGEISGSVPDLVRRLANLYEEETKAIVPGLIKAVFPLLLPLVALAYFADVTFLGIGVFVMLFFFFLTA